MFSPQFKLERFAWERGENFNNRKCRSVGLQKLLGTQKNEKAAHRNFSRNEAAGYGLSEQIAQASQ